MQAPPTIRSWLSLISALLAMLVAGSAGAQDSKKAECAGAYETAQEKRAEGKLQQARKALVMCAQAECPSFVQTDCATWLSEVMKELPSVVISAKDPEGIETAQVKVTYDGDVLAEKLTGKALIVDPGMHEFLFEFEGQEPIQRKMMIRQGEKNRVIEVSFAPDAPPPPPEDEATDDPTEDLGPAPEEDRSKRTLRLIAYGAGGVGAAGLISFAVFGTLASGQEDDLAKKCPKGQCSLSDKKLEQEKSSISQKALIADISLGVGIAGLATGTVLFFLSAPPSEESAASSALRFDVGPTAGGGGFATLSGAF